MAGKLFYFQFLIFLFFSCTVFNKTELSDKTLFSLNGKPTSADEFLYVYEKNNFNNEKIYSDKDVDEYFELFKNFKLKVEAAKAEGIDTTKAFLEEFENYKDQLIKPYLSEAREKEKLVEEAYERMKYEIDASHILVMLDPDATPEDTLKAHQKIFEINEKAKGGADFGDLAMRFSEDPSAKRNKGRLGYFSVFQMVFAFENAAYNTPADSISDIFRSRFGYHILKVHDKRPSTGKVKVSHIMLRTKPGDNSNSIKNKIFEIHDQLVGGADWNQLCQQYSEDLRTKNNGGTLPFIGLKQINDKAFEDVAFNLENPGDISDPVRSSFGWHIIKLEEKKGLGPFDEIKEDIEQKVAKDDRSKLSKKAVVKKLKKQNNFILVEKSNERLLELADSTLLLGKWNVPKPVNILSDTLFFIDDQVFKTELAIGDIEINQKRRTGLSPKEYMHELIDNFITSSLMDFEEKQLIASNREFRMLLNEYYEGILLFEIMNQKVWGKAVEDTLGLKKYFKEHQENYKWGERVNGIIFTSTNESTIDEIKKSLEIEQYKLLEKELDIDEAQDVLKNPSIDSIVNIYKLYELSTITVLSNKNLVDSKIYRDLEQYFRDLNIERDIIYAVSDNSKSNKIYLILNSRSKKSLEYLYNQESALNLQVTEGIFEKGDNQMIDSVGWQTGAYGLKRNTTHHLIYISDILPEQPKKLNDVKGSVISDYQDYLEQSWLEELKNKYTIEVDYTVLDKIKKSFKN